MGQNSLVKEYLKENIIWVNSLLSKVCLAFMLICPTLLIASRTGLVSFDAGIQIKICLAVLVCATMPYFVVKYTYNEDINRYTCLVCLEIVSCLLTQNGVVNLDIMYFFVPFISVLYLQKDIFLHSVRNCFLVMVAITGLRALSQLQQSAIVFEHSADIFKSLIDLYLEYILVMLVLAYLRYRFEEMVASGYSLETRRDGTVTTSSILKQEQVQIEEEYNTKGLFLEINTIIQGLIRGKGKAFMLDVDNELPIQLSGDKEKIKLIMVNVLSDFLRFTMPGGVVTLRVTYDKGIVPKKGQNISLFCRISCSQDLSEDIRYGDAMGLALAKNLIQKLNGVMLDKSDQQEEGATAFTISLLQKVVDEETLLHLKMAHQAEQKELIADSRKRAQDILLAKQVKVLIVDDSTTVQKLVDAILKAYGMITHCVSSGDEAIEALKTKGYDLVIIDHMMPVKGALQTAREIRQMDDPYFELLPLMAMTSNLTEESKQVFYDVGFTSVISKPVKEEELRQVMSETMFL